MTDSEDFDSDNTDSEDVDSEDVDCVPDCPSDPAQEWRDYEEQAGKGGRLCGPGSRKPCYKGPRSKWQWWRRLYRCSACTQFKPRKAFGGRFGYPRSYTCSECKRAQSAAYRRSPRGRVLRLFWEARRRSKEREMPYQLPDPKKPTQVFQFFFGLVRECRAHLLPLAVTVTVVVVAELARLAFSQVANSIRARSAVRGCRPSGLRSRDRMSDGGIGPTTSPSSTEIGRAHRVPEPRKINLARNGPRPSTARWHVFATASG